MDFNKLSYRLFAVKSQILSTIGFFFLCSLYAQNNHNIYINEFLASNVSIDADIVDFDDYSDWIELYNNENFDVDLGGYFLTDDLENPIKWEIPPGTTITSKGFLRFWADGYDDSPGSTYWRSWLGPNAERLYFTTDYYHLNFKLSRAGESIGLFSPDGILIDSVNFGLQHRDISMGRKPDGSTTWLYFGEPTPEAANSTEGVLDLQYAEKVQISPESGFNEGNQEISLNSGSGESVFTYTTNGSKPESTSEPYFSPIDITESTVIRARQFEEGKLPGSIVSRSYFLNESIKLPIISIITPPEALWDDFNGIYRENVRMKGREIPVAIDFFDSNQNPPISMNAGLRLTGQASLYYPQVSFTVYARDRYGTDEFGFQVFPQRELNSFKSLYLRNAGVPDNRSTFFRDALQHSLVLNKIDIDCQAYQPSVIFLNGEYWGIYNIRDKINSDYIGSLHNLNPDDIDLLEYELGSSMPVVMEGNADNYNLFYNYVKETDLSQEDHYRFVETWMDMDEFINYQICEIYYDNVFWPDQNIRMWRERKEGAKWRWILFDTDYGFGMPNNLSSGYRNNTLGFATSSNPDGLEAPEWSTLIFRKLLANNEFRTKFIQRFDTYMNSIFHPDTVLSAIDELQNSLSPEMPRHINKWKNGAPYYGDPIQSFNEWTSNVDVMKDFATNRPQYQRQHITDYFELSGSSLLQLNINNPGSGKVRINDAVVADTSASGIYFKDIPVELKAIPNVGYRFIKWEGIDEDSLENVNILITADTLTITAVFDTSSVNTVPSGLYSDTTLFNTLSPYYASNDIIIQPNTTLRIESGVELFMPEKANILVYGRLVIEGSEENPVVIAPNENSLSWGALCFLDATDSSMISNLKIRGATSGPEFSRDKAAISGFGSDFSLTKVTVEDSDLPVFVQYGNVSIKECLLKSGIPGDLINVKRAESVLVEDCDLRGNDYFDSDAIDYDQVSKGIIRGNRIYNFYGFNSDAIDLGEGSSEILIENNVIYNVSDKGISIGNGSTAIIKRNLIANCGQGIGIKDFGSYGYIEHNTFYANQYGIACFEKNIGGGGGNADVVNCIIANSRIQSVYTDQLSSTSVSYSLINSDDPGGLHNILGEPFFINNLHLAENSPAVNSGNPTLPEDPDGSLPDMGAYPFDEQNQVDLRINEIHYHPVEGENYEFIEIVNAGVSAININGMALSGDIEFTFPDETILPGELFLLANDQSVYEGQGYKVYQWEKGNLRDGPGSLLLRSDQGEVIDFVHYNTRYWWPREPDGQGSSLELHEAGLENMVACNWRSSYSDGGTPGKANGSVFISGIYINEFLSANNSVSADQYEEYDDWIEIYNSTDKPVNIGGLFITDNLEDPFKHQIPFYDAEATTIPAGEFILLWADGEVNQGILHLNFRLDQAGEQIGLVQMVDGEAVFIDSLTYNGQVMDISFGRYTDGAGDWYSLTEPTPMQSNIWTSTGHKTHLTRNNTLLKNYPNPFRSSTMITYQLQAPGDVELSIYDLSGRKLTTLLNKIQPAGRHEIEWVSGNMQPGIYFCEMETLRGRHVIKMILID